MTKTGGVHESQSSSPGKSEGGGSGKARKAYIMAPLSIEEVFNQVSTVSASATIPCRDNRVLLTPRSAGN